MKRLFGIFLSVCALGTSVASAGNNCCESECGTFNFYVGGDLGVTSWTAHRNDLDGFLTDNSGWSSVDTGFVGGGLIGLDWQKCNMLIGVVADWNGAGPKTTFVEEPNDDTDNHYIKNDFSSILTIRGRFGVVVGDAAVYVTAGAARATFKTRWFDDPTEFRYSDKKWGWTGGVGTEYRLGCNLTLGTELLVAHFDDKTHTFEDPNNLTTFYSFRGGNTVWSAKVVLKYNFGDFSQLCCW